MADKQTGGPRSGGASGGSDQTTQPGQYPSHLPFNIMVPKGTGAPGTQGSGPSPDPTVHTPTPEAPFGGHEDNLHTGSPGSAGGNQPLESGAHATNPFGYLAGGGKAVDKGCSTDTEGHVNKYGSSTMPGVAGMGQPKSTGAGEGHTMIGGRGGN